MRGGLGGQKSGAANEPSCEASVGTRCQRVRSPTPGQECANSCYINHNTRHAAATGPAHAPKSGTCTARQAVSFHTLNPQLPTVAGIGWRGTTHTTLPNNKQHVARAGWPAAHSLRSHSLSTSARSAASPHHSLQRHCCCCSQAHALLNPRQGVQEDQGQHGVGRNAAHRASHSPRGPSQRSAARTAGNRAHSSSISM
jgi:hypothetical protein